MIYKYPNVVIMVFCKAPIAGQVKTRLTPAFSVDEAVDIHVELSLKALRLVTQNRLCPVQLWCFPSAEHPFFAAAELDFAVSLHTQQGLDLGDRMHRAFCSALAHNACAIIIGCDCPSLTEHVVEQALIAVQRPNSCVLAPAEDGGYVLIGLDKVNPSLFRNIAWGTEDVFQQTRARIEALQLDYVELPEQWDVDLPMDLIRYRASVFN